MTESVISVQNVCRRFGRSRAVDGVSFDVARGSIFGLLGTNGAGKTTMIRLLMGHLYPDSGELRVLGENPRRHNAETLRRVAYVSDRMQLPGRMCLRDVLRLNEQFFPKWNAEFAAQTAQQFGIDITVPYGRMSLGQKRGAVLVQAVSQGADLLILDEPLSGLDAIIRRKCLDLLLSAAVEHGQTVVISSHLLNDVERIVDTIAVLNQGKPVTAGNLEELKARLRRIRIDGELSSAELDPILREFRVLKQSAANHVTSLVVDGFGDRSQQWLTDAFGSRVCVEHLNLEDIFVELSDRPSSAQPSPIEAGANL